MHFYFITVFEKKLQNCTLSSWIYPCIHRVTLQDTTTVGSDAAFRVRIFPIFTGIYLIMLTH